MHLALLYHGVLPVKGYGGTPRVVVWLARGLAELGHRVSLLAGAGSAVPEATLVPLDPRRAERADFDVRPFLPPGVDVLHAHRPLGPAEVPTLWTLHGNARPGKSYPPNLVCLSADHARRHGTEAFVYNGLDPGEYRFEPRKSDFDLFLGRLHGAKGWRWAMEGAGRAGRPLVVAGGWRPTLRPGLRFVGTVEGAQKRDLLAEAACLWMPALWDEPFGLTLIEALASGTPVLGTRRGSLPEVVSADTGALGDTLDELVALRPTLDRVDPEACRARVTRRFSHRTLAEEYLRFYRTLVATGTLPAGRPAGPDG
jgi:glycosyltransferase involved in cell wall biosynthesis